MMNNELRGPIINSRHDGNLPTTNKGVFVVAALVLMLAIGGVVLFIREQQPAVQKVDTEEVLPVNEQRAKLLLLKEKFTIYNRR